MLQTLAELQAEALERHKRNPYMPPLVPTETLVAAFEGVHSESAVKKALTSLRKQDLVGTHKRWSGWRPTETAAKLLAA